MDLAEHSPMQRPMRSPAGPTRRDQAPERLSPWTLRLALALTASAAACSGRVGDPAQLGPPPSSSPSPSASASPTPSPSTPLTCATAPRDPGRVTLHRLNRAEYDNTVRDLISTTQKPAQDFPSDDHGYGFDNIADVLSMAPLLAEKYQLAAEGLVTEIFATPFAGPATMQAEAEQLTGTVGNGYGGSAWNLYSNGEIVQQLTITIAGNYRLSTRLFGQQAGPEPARAELSIDGRVLGSFDIPEVEATPRTLSVDAMLTAGVHTFRVAFTNDYYDAASSSDRNLIVDWLRAVGPTDYQAPATNPAARAKVMICDPVAMGREPCARMILKSFARRAWRRPITAAEETRLYNLANVAFAEMESFETGIGLGLQAVLLSPHFLFRVELDPDPSSATPHPLSAHELATRLSYFLWSSTPDDALSTHADDGSLSDPTVLRSEVRRMLADPKATALVDNFAGQWLYTRRVADVLPDPTIYPTFDESLRSSMAAETRELFRTFLTENRNALDILDADFSFVNDRLAQHYGLPAVGSTELRRVSLPAGQRGGLLTQASVLTVTSRPRRTAPVIRGKWIMEQILCTAPPPPPPNVEGFPENITTTSVRQRLEQHRANPNCASCHNLMDPLGLALEQFDGVGSFRTMDAGQPVDASGRLPDGRSFNGAKELAAMLKSDPGTSRCFTERTFVYALGRGPESFDRCSITDITAAMAAGGNSFPAMIDALVTHPAFTSRRGEP